MTIAEQVAAMYAKYPAAIVDALVDAWWVKKQVVVGNDDATYVFEDFSSISKVERIASRTKQFAGDIPVYIRPHYRMNVLFDIADLSKVNPTYARGLRAMLDRETGA
jgi:hypothetical protein